MDNKQTYSLLSAADEQYLKSTGVSATPAKNTRKEVVPKKKILGVFGSDTKTVEEPSYGLIGQADKVYQNKFNKVEPTYGEYKTDQGWISGIMPEEVSKKAEPLSSIFRKKDIEKLAIKDKNRIETSAWEHESSEPMIVPDGSGGFTKIDKDEKIWPGGTFQSVEKIDKPSFFERRHNEELGTDTVVGMILDIGEPDTEAEKANKRLWFKQQERKDKERVMSLQYKIQQLDTSLPADYKEPTSRWGQFKESFINNYEGSVQPAIGYFVEALGRQLGVESMQEWGADFADRQILDYLSKPELLSPDNMDSGEYIARSVGGLLPVSLSIMGPAIVAGIVTGGAGALVVGLGGSYAIEQGNAYGSMIRDGVDPGVAAKASSIYGAAASVIENSFGISPAKFGLKAVEGKFFEKVIAKNFKSYIIKELPRMVGLGFLDSAVEGGEEVIQDISERLVNNWIGNNKELFSGNALKQYAEEFLSAGVGSIPLGMVDTIKLPAIESKQGSMISEPLSSVLDDTDRRVAVSYDRPAVSAKVLNDAIPTYSLGDSISTVAEDTSLISSAEIISGKDAARDVISIGSDQGGLSDWTVDKIKKEDYKQEIISIEELRRLDLDLDEYLKSTKGEVREFDGEPSLMDPIVSSSGEVIDGYNRISQKIADGETEISILRGIKTEKGVSAPKELPDINVKQLDDISKELFIKRNGQEDYDEGVKEGAFGLEKIEQVGEEYDEEFIERHPELAGEQIIVYHDAVMGEDLAVVSGGRVIEVFDPEIISMSKRSNVVAKNISEKESVKQSLSLQSDTIKSIDSKIKSLNNESNGLSYYMNARQMQEAQRLVNEILSREPNFNIEEAIDEGASMEQFKDYFEEIKNKQVISGKKYNLPSYMDFTEEINDPKNPFTGLSYEDAESKYEELIGDIETRVSLLSKKKSEINGNVTRDKDRDRNREIIEQKRIIKEARAESRDPIDPYLDPQTPNTSGAKHVMKPSKDLQEEWGSALGPYYKNVFNKDAKMSPSGLASELGYEDEKELMQAMEDRVRHRQTLYEKEPIYDMFGNKRKARNQETTFKEYFPEIYRVMQSGLNAGWADFTLEDKIATKLWVKQGQEGLPEQVVENLIKRGFKNTGRNTVKSPISKYDDVWSGRRDFESILALKIDKKHAIDALSEMARAMNARVYIDKMGKERGKITFGGKEILISIKDINDFITLGTEVGHLFDNIILKSSPKTSLADRVGSLISSEVNLARELKELSKYIGSYAGKTETQPVELFADWFVAYINEPQWAYSIAPEFTGLMEKAYPQDLKNILDKYRIDPNKLTPKEMPTKGVIRWFNKFFGINEKISLPSNVIVKHRESRNVLTIADNKLAQWIQLPYWIAQRDKRFAEVFRPIYRLGYNAHFSDLAHIARIMHFDETIRRPKEELENERNVVARALYVGNDVGKYWDRETFMTKFDGTKEDWIDYSNKVVGIKLALKRVIDRNIEDIWATSSMTPEEKMAAEEHVRKMEKQMDGYIPTVREGNVHVSVVRKDENGNSTVLFTQFTKTIHEAKVLAKRLSDMGYRDKIYVYKILPKNLSFFKQIAGSLDLYSLDRILETLGINENENKDVLAIRDFIKKARMQGRLVHRKMIPGYERNLGSATRAIAHFANYSSRHYWRSKATRSAREALVKIDPHKNPEIYALSNSFIENWSWSDQDQFLQLRKGLFVLRLAGRASQGAQNLTQPYITTIPELANHVGFVKAPAYYALGIKDATKWLKGSVLKKKTSTNPLHARLIQRAVDERVISGVLAQQLLSDSNYKVDAVFQALSFIQKQTELWNRYTTAFAALRVATDALKMTDENKIYVFMSEMVNRTQYPYGSYNLPNIIAGAGKMKGLAKTMLMFKSWPINYIHFISQRVLHGNLAAKAWWGIMNMIFVGALGFPFMSIIRWMIRKITGRDPVIVLRGAVGEDNQWMADVMMNGAFPLGNINVTNLVGMGDIISPSYDPMGQIFGPGYSLGDDIMQAYNYISDGDYDKALELIMPSSLNSLLVGGRWQEEGVKIGNKQIELTTSEVVQKMLGFTPNRIYKEYDFKSVVNSYSGQMTTIKNRISNDSKRGMTYADIKDKYLDDVKEYNRKVLDELAVMTAVGVPITHKQKDSLITQYTISGDEIKNAYNKGHDEYKRIQKWTTKRKTE